MGCSPPRINPSYENPYIEYTTNSQKLPPSVLEGFGTVLQCIKNPIKSRSPRYCLSPKNSKVEEDFKSSNSFSELAHQGLMHGTLLDTPSSNEISKRFMGLHSNKSAEFLKSISRSLKIPLRAVTPQIDRITDIGRGFPELVDNETKEISDYENTLKKKAKLEKEQQEEDKLLISARKFLESTRREQIKLQDVAATEEALGIQRINSNNTNFISYSETVHLPGNQKIFSKNQITKHKSLANSVNENFEWYKRKNMK
ncbi:hypothetical protein SteCoe_33224 [Stentor coeruleus]|uniref:Uncharacterized protein n=1 Tax=Stentor coeruleus TaxID=5963 RepID=A0A1R2AX99_9CILI|nr:hypothetical protein SteCoe_33224 [Stentor coeruleus]